MVILYPAIPMLHGASSGTLGWTSHGQLEKEMMADHDRRAPTMRALAMTPIEGLPADKQLLRTAQEGGRSAFKVYCTQCHGAGAAGGKGYPNLRDDVWLWGGTLDQIHQTIRFGVRNANAESRQGVAMPACEKSFLL